MVLIAKATGPRIPALADRTGAVTHLDWRRQRPLPEPQQPGRDVTMDGRATSALVPSCRTRCGGSCPLQRH